MMNNVSFGSSEATRNWAPAQPVIGQRSHGKRHHPMHDVHEVAKSPLARVWAGFSSSVSSMRTQLESLSSSMAGTDTASSMSGMGAQVINKQRGELQIRTQEGDVVTLKFNSKVGVSIDAAQSSEGETTASEVAIELRSRSRVSVQIEGNLNDAEQAAIDDLVDKVGDLTNEFFSGDVDGALAQAAALSFDSSQLSNYSLDLRLKQSVRAYAYEVRRPVVAEAPFAVAPPVAVPEIEATPEIKPVVEAVAQSVNAEPVTPASDVVPAPNTEAPGKVAASVPLAEFVAKVRARFSVQEGDTRLGLSYEFKARLLVASIEVNAPKQAEPSAAALQELNELLVAAA